MASNIPSFARAAIADPKAASTESLETVLLYYSNATPGEVHDIIAEEFERRTHDGQYIGERVSGVEYSEPFYD